MGILPFVKTTSLRPDANMEEHVSSDMLRLRKSPGKSQRKVVRKDQLHYQRSLHNWVVHLKILIRKSLFNVKKENWDQNTPSNSPRARGTKKIGKERVHREALSQNERSPCAPIFGERSHEETLHQERRARRVAWDLAKIFTSSRMWTKLRFTLLLKQGKCWRPLQKVQRNENSWLTPEHQCTCWATRI